MKRLLVLTAALCLIQFSKAATPFLHTSQGASGVPECCIVLPVKNGSDSALTRMEIPVYTGIYRNNIFRKRLDSIQKDVQLDYNEYVQAEIDNYLSTERVEISRELGLSKYYFPIYEKAFRETGIPDEIKYLSVVESRLNPNAVSRVGATGPWQFMNNTARIYGLTMDDYVDERKDPVQSSYAAAAYLKDAYQQFGDWLLAIASYNCGKSNVIRAIEEAGSNDFWAIRQYLPAETRDYVPLYIAITYVMKYHKNYNIVPQECYFSTETDTVQADKFISLTSVSRTLSIDLAQLTLLNPSYKRLIVNGSAESPKSLVIPKNFKAKYAALYGSINCELADADLSTYGLYDRIRRIESRPPIHHRSRKFDTMASVGQKKKVNSFVSYHLEAPVVAKLNKG
ncbi:lytic transglycosylase domain-containing protein [Mucilaginibacter sp.]|jgi:membrane-bound lytic murein transglycosylase D|uniref:lytic transglycosylase domain-containing protein n=1 Tax=Mucilaginibacter sp. TaxID=1882438 RepID=UPI002B6AB3C1|nr:lytic transglycosylase domain-containing protein [Mucilaginibacter sp.]HTI59676.1 lytic transglycosylase domain-containing protein [Mucilaginibacter sp.]